MKTSIEMIEEATGGPRKVKKKVKVDTKTDAKKDSAPKKDTLVDSGAPGSHKSSKSTGEGKESLKDKRERRKSKKVDIDMSSGELGTAKTSTPSKDAGTTSTSAASPGGATSPSETPPRTKSRPKSMMIPNAKDLLMDSMEASADAAPSKSSGHKLKSVKHMSTSKPQRQVEDVEKPTTPSKLKGPSRESSRSDLDAMPASPSNSRRKSVGSTGRASVKSPLPVDAAMARTASGIKMTTAPSTPKTDATASTTAETSTDTSTTQNSAQHAADVAPSSESAVATTGASSTGLDSLGAHGRASSKVGEVRAMFEKKTAAVTPSSGLSTPSGPSPRTAGATSTVVTSATTKVNGGASTSPELTTQPVSPHTANTTAAEASDSGSPSTARSTVHIERRPLPKTSSEDSESSKSGTVLLSREEYRRLKSDMTHYRRGYDHWKAKYKDLESSMQGSPHAAVLASAAALALDPVDRLSRSGSLSDLASSSFLPFEAELTELKRQTVALNARNAELTAMMDALALKFKLTMENVGIRLDSIELQLKKLQTDFATMNLDIGTGLGSARGSVDLTQLSPGARTSITIDSLNVDPEAKNSSPRIQMRRGTSQKEVGKRSTSSNLLRPSNPSNLSGTTSPTPASPTHIKDVRVFWNSFIIDLSTLRRKVIVPLLSQPVESLDKRTRVVCEMLDTEQKYIFGIEVMIANWEKPLLAYANVEPKIPLNDMKSIFGDGWLQFMVNNNIKHLCQKLESRLLEWTETSTVGDIFLDFEPYLHPYKRYCSRYEESLRLLTTLASTNTKFKKALEYFDNHCFGFNGLRLRDYLITPVQRVPRYNLLLRDLLNSTPESHPDHPLLTNALNKISSTATDINEGIRQAESQLMMREIAERGNGFEALTKGNSYRSHVKTGAVDVLVDLLDRRRGLPNRKPELLIFNDLIVSGAFVNKKAIQQEYAIPAALAWIVSDLTESPEDLNPLLEGCPRQNAFLIRGPESLWLVGIKKQSDLLAFKDALLNVIGCPQAELANGRRRGRYDFMKLPGTYDGQWADGEFHGTGTYVKTDGTLFDGYWDGRFKAGFGQIMAGGQGQHVGGWKNNRPESDVVEFKDHHLWDSRIELTERDWAILMTGAREVQYKKDQKVVEQDLPNMSLFKIKSGRCRVEKDTTEGRVTLVTLQPGAYFGDTSVLPMMRVATADVICDSLTAEINVIGVSILFEILKTDPALAMRFFRQLARTLANRLRSLHQGPAARAPERKKRSESSGELPAIKAPEGEDDVSNIDSNYIEKFDLPAGECIIKDMTAALRGVIKKYGHLYLSQRFLCFESHVFGMNSKDVIPLDRITKVEMIKKKYILVQTRKSKYEFTVDNLEELHSLLASMTTTVSTSSSSNHPSKPHHEDSSRLLHVEKSSDDTQTASSEDSRDQRSGSITGHPTGPKRKSTAMTLSVNDETDTGTLTSADWGLLQQGFKCIIYAKDKPITLQGTTHLTLFQIAKGVCRIEIQGKDANTPPQVVGSLGPNALFGEISFLDGSPATASVIANEDGVEVYVIEGSFINMLFVKYPDLAGRFFAYLAGVIAGRLNEREATRGAQDKKQPRRTRTKQFTVGPATPTPAIPSNQ